MYPSSLSTSSVNFCFYCLSLSFWDNIFASSALISSFFLVYKSAYWPAVSAYALTSFINFLTNSQSFLKYSLLALNDSYSFLIKSSKRWVSSFFVLIFKLAKYISLFFSMNSIIVSLFSLRIFLILYYYFLIS